MNEGEACVICNESLTNGGPTVKLRQKNSNGINRANKICGQLVHTECQKLFTCERRLSLDQKSKKVQ